MKEVLEEAVDALIVDVAADNDKLTLGVKLKQEQHHIWQAEATTTSFPQVTKA